MNRTKAVMTFCVFGILFGIEVVTFSPFLLTHTIAWKTGLASVLTVGCIVAFLVAIRRGREGRR